MSISNMLISNMLLYIPVNDKINIVISEYVRIYCVDTGLYVYSAFMEDLRTNNICILLEYNNSTNIITLYINNLIVHSRKISSIPINSNSNYELNNLYKIIFI